MSLRISLLLTAAALTAGSFAFAQDRPPVPPWTKDAPPKKDGATSVGHKVEIPWDRYYSIDEFYAIQKKLAAAYPDLLTNQVIGQSVEGRDLLLTTINDPSTGKAGDKPAFWCDGNIHGNEVQAGEACLYLIWYLCENREKLPRIKKLLEEHAFYVLPSLNPDGRAHWFDAPNTMHSSRGGKRPVDNDRDGRFDEDPPNDLDGDGELLQMRVRDPDGPWRTDPDHPDRMVRVRDGQKGEWRLIGLEGIDDDGDGQINEDGPGGYDPNRDWPADWRGPSEQRGAGPYPLSLPESRAVADFLVAHPNVAGFQSFHNTGGMILRGPGSKTSGAYPRRDDAVMSAVADEGVKILPHYRNMVIWKDLYQVYGGSVNFAYETLGIYAYTNELWTSARYFHEKTERSDRRDRRRDFDDLVEHGARYVAWKPFRHPTLGDIELGGWRKETGRVAPPFMIQEMLHRNAAFVIYHAEQMPKVRPDGIEVVDKGDGVREVTATFRNLGRFPTRSQMAVDKKIGAPDAAVLRSPSSIHILASGLVDSRGQLTDPVLKRPSRFVVERGIDGRNALKIRWLVRGTGDVTVTYTSPKGGAAKQSAKLE